jgi:hypothetical protein
MASGKFSVLSLLRSRFQSGFHWQVSGEMLLLLLIECLALCSFKGAFDNIVH